MYTRNDPFDEMDAIFDLMVARMFGAAGTGMQPHSGYRIVIERGGDSLLEPGRQPQPDARPGASLPEPEVHRIGDEVRVVAELPGADPGSVRPEVRGTTLVIDADTGTLHYHTFAEIPPCDAGLISHTFKNGVLEVCLKVRRESIRKDKA